jgi:site-specific DNA-methyltransferase (adenine-specific)
MNTQARFMLRGRNPDILTCIANLSNDEVFTPPELANQMLDTLAQAWAANNDGANIWADKTVTFLDPCTKSGVFLREITSRLTEGLKDAIPDLQKRVDHILTKQVFGIGITQITSLLARRSVYCSKYANGEHSIAQSFTDEAGNIWFERTEHTWEGNKCKYCSAPKVILDRSEGVENYAYPFIHTDNIKTWIAKKFGGDMQFDVVIGNPPYQLDDGGFGTSAAPIYHKFIERALALKPRFASFVTPSRWMAGGKGLDDFRRDMLSDKRLVCIVDFPKLYEAFPGVKIRGGVSYFLWNGGHSGHCSFQTIWDGKPTGPAVQRDLGAFDVLVRRNEAIPILEKVRARGESNLSAFVSSRKPFGLPTNFRGKGDKRGLTAPVQLFENQRTGWIERDQILANPEWVDRWKVLMTRVQGTSAAVETKFLSKPIVAGPGTACTETYLVAGAFESQQEADRLAAYLRTRFVRFLVSLRKPSQDATRAVYGFVPNIGTSAVWTDALLYSRYGLSESEVKFIESQVALHDGAGSDMGSGDDDRDD